MNRPDLISWGAIVAVGGIAAGMVVFVQNLMTIRNLQLENRVLREKLSTDSRRVHLPTSEEVGRYGRSHHNLAGLGLVLFAAASVLAAGLLGVRIGQNAVAANRHASFDEALEGGLRAGDPKAVDAALALGKFYAEKGHYKTAETLYERALTAGQLRGSVAGELPALDGLAAVARAQHEYARAEALYKRSLEIQERSLGAEHPEIARTLNNLAEVYRAQHKYAKAEDLYTRSLHIQERALGPEDPETVDTLEGLAAVYRATGRKEEAAAFDKRVRQIRGLLENQSN